MPTIDKREIDELDLRIMEALQGAARLSLAELGRRVHLSAPAVAERLRRLERGGFITGYHASVDARLLGKPILAFVRVSSLSDVVDRLTAVAQRRPEVLECHRVTGNECFIMKVVVASIPDLEKLIDEFTPFGQITTSIVLSAPISSRPVSVRVPQRSGKREKRVGGRRSS